MFQKSKEQIKQEMDQAAEIASQELNQLDPNAVKVVATWMKNHYMKAGYKRLGRILVNKVK